MASTPARRPCGRRESTGHGTPRTPAPIPRVALRSPSARAWTLEPDTAHTASSASKNAARRERHESRSSNSPRSIQGTPPDLRGCSPRSSLECQGEQDVLESQTRASPRPIQRIKREGPGSPAAETALRPSGVLCSVVPAGSGSNCVPGGRGPRPGCPPRAGPPTSPWSAARHPRAPPAPPRDQ